MFLISHVISLTNDNTGNSLLQAIVYLEYFFPLIFYFLFIVSFIYIILNNQKINLILKILLIINSFLLGFSAELANIPISISMTILAVLLYIFDKKLFKKNLLLLIIPFITGLILFYATSQYMQGKGGNGVLIFVDAIILADAINLNNFIGYLTYFIKYMFFENIFYYVLILFLSIILIFKRNKNINIIIITLFSVILGYLITNLSFLFFQPGLVQRCTYQCIHQNILGFVIVILAGAVYYQFYKYKKHFIILFSVILIAMIISYNHYNKIFQDIVLERKIFSYKLEKLCVIYSILGELAILPQSYLDNAGDKVFGIRALLMPDTDADYFVDNWDNMLWHLSYLSYFYKLPFFGYMFVNDNHAYKELEKRLKIFGEKWETDEEIKLNNISFKSLNKYKNFNLELKDIEKIEETEENKGILLKAKAYIYYKNDNLEKAFELYKEYNNKYPEDYSILNNILELCSKLKEYYIVENILNKSDLSSIYSDSVLRKCFSYYYYYKKDYDRALKIYQYIINIGEHDTPEYNIGKTLILLKQGKKKEADEVLKYINEDLSGGYYISKYLNEHNISSFDDINELTDAESIFWGIYPEDINMWIQETNEQKM